MGGILAPKRFTFIWKEGHRHDWIAFDIVSLRIPDEFAATCPGKIANILSMEDPSFFIFRFFFLVFGSFLRSNNKGWAASRFGSFEPFLLRLA